MALVELVGVWSLAAAALITVRAGLASAEVSDLTTYRLTFPPDLPSESVSRVLVGVCGLMPPWWHRIIYRPVVIFETEASTTGISHWLLVPPAHGSAVEAALSAHAPSVRWEPVDRPAPAPFSLVHRMPSTKQAAMGGLI